MKQTKYKEYSFDGGRYGIDDLKSIYAFHGNSQGDESRSNDVLLYINAGGWMSLSNHFKDVDEFNQADIDKRSKEIDLDNKEYIKRLKQDKKYGQKRPDTTLLLKTMPIYDTNDFTKETPNKVVDSYKMTMLDFSK